MQLPRHEREVVELCVWSGLDQRAAAVALGVSVGTVKSRMHRARQRLAASLGQDRGALQRPLAPRGADPRGPEEDARWARQNR
jgi:DNA-directed RNA polymerase specialized sigma24 family protein